MKLTYLNRQSRSKRKRKGINTINFGSLLIVVLFVAWVMLFISVGRMNNNNHDVLPISSTSTNNDIKKDDNVITNNNKRINYRTTDEKNYYLHVKSNDRTKPHLSRHNIQSISTSSSALRKNKTLHLYFINLDKSADRAAALKENIASLSWNSQSTFQLHRVHAITVNEVKELYKNGSLYFKQVEEQESLKQNGRNEINTIHNETKLIDRARRSKDINTFTFHEVACTLSHLRAIKQAYDDGQEMAIILEDDALISQDFVDNWESYADQAPSDWQILQWMTSNTFANKRSIHTHHDFWMSWRWYFWGAVLYSIRREGMERIIKASYENIKVKTRSNIGYDTMTSSTTTHADRWMFSEPQVVTADSLVFYLTKTYTSTYPWITLRNCSSTIMHGDREDYTFGKSSIAIPPPLLTESQLLSMKRPETIAIVMNLRLKDIASATDEIQSLKVDVEVLSNIHPHSRWFVKIVLVNDSLKPYVEDMLSSHLPISGIGAMVDIHLEVNRDRFNKFEFLRSILDELKTYEYVLLKDNDIAIAGFEWNAFMDAKGSSTLSSPFYETSEDWLERNRIKRNYSRQLVNFQHGVNFNKYDDASYSSALEPISTMFLEMKFILMKAEFADWFFSRIFQAQFFINQDISWGVDLMWCGAAHQYNIIHDNGKMNACSLIPLNILDRDTKQISKPDDFNMRGNELVKRWRSDPRFSSWFSKIPLKHLSRFQLTLVPKQYTLRDVRRICAPLRKTKIDMSECGKKIHSVVVKAYKEPEQ